MPSNTAAWLTAAKAKPLEVKPAPYTAPGEHEIVVKAGALAVNPIDWKLQEEPFYPLDYPTILGQDVAGEVVEVGGSVSRFSKGDRVVGHALGFITKRNAEAGFQEYSILQDHMASPIPRELSFDYASVIPLGLSTAAAGLFQKGYLELQHPSVNIKPTGKTLLVWGGSSSVGVNAIQLAVAAGYEVITTASSKNFDLVKKLGASQVFDYNSKTIVNELVGAFKNKILAGVFDAINVDGAFTSCIEVADQSTGNKFVASSLRIPEKLPSGVSAKWIFAVSIRENEVSKAIYETFLPQALAEGRFVAAPEPHVVGKGIEYVQAGLDALKNGVSAKKVVITL
ncbi:MAG: hypothetical protein M4579_005608 [Chaenotheca gracillima]|nr:MAG: hypothetical protein M4579_005608 [Chaenotheca gracillima]